ncbi:MAG: PIN domain-containing protein [Acidobacteriota bacterium]
MTPVLLDTGVIVAFLDRRDRHHAACVAALDGLSGPLLTCEAVIAESCYLLQNVDGAKQAILQNISAGIFQIPFQLSRAAAEIQRIFKKYRDREVDLADACLIHLANELRSGDILTLDSDFQVYRWGTNKPFRSLVNLDRV